MFELVGKDNILKECGGAEWYVSEEATIIIHKLDKTFKEQDFVVLTPEELCTMNAALAQCLKQGLSEEYES